MRRVFSAAAAVLAATAPAIAAPDPVLDVATVDRDLSTLNGRTVRVRGWMLDCGPDNMSCAIAPAPGDRAHALAIGGATVRIDRSFRRWAGREAILVAQVDDSCRRGLCTDRASVLRVERIAPVAAASTPSKRR